MELNEFLTCFLGAGCFLLFLLFFSSILLAFGMVGGAAVNTIQYNETNKGAWQTLAKANHLEFVQVVPNSFQGAYVTGDYRGRSLTLNTFGQDKATWTRIVLSKADTGIEVDASVDGVADQLPIKDLLKSLDTHYRLKGWVEVQPHRQEIIYQQLGIEADLAYLKSIFDLLSNLADAYPKLVGAGRKAVPLLKTVVAQNSGLETIVGQIIEDIEKMERYRKRLLDKQAADEQHQMPLEIRAKVVARLDRAMTEEQIQKDNVVFVNWLKFRTLAYFDEVEIVQATDEEVERFATQIGNDMDDARKARHQQIICRVYGESNLSENTLRVLQHIFSQVETVGSNTLTQTGC